LSFVAEFVEEVERKKRGLLELLSDGEGTARLEAIVGRLEQHWHRLPAPEQSYHQEFSVDSSSASRTLSTGHEFFIIQALMLGSQGTRTPKVWFEMVKGIPDAAVSHGFERILRDLMEVEIVRESLPHIPQGSLVLIDGNLYGRYTHPMKQLDLPGWRHLPLQLMESMQRLFQGCRERGVTLVGVSKFSKTRALTAALQAELGETREPEYLDVELLARVKEGETGYTTPLLLGSYALQRNPDALEDPEKYLDTFFRELPPSKRGWALEVLKGVPTTPAIAMIHFIPRAHAQPLRVDIPANGLGVEKTLWDVRPFEFLAPSLVGPLLGQLVSDFGGRDVYNALLYVVDREVRLGGSQVDGVYKSLLSSQLGRPIEYDRSTRRFTL